MSEEENVTITIPKKSYEFLKDLIREINQQDNRSTATPYYYVVREPKWRSVDPDYANGRTKTVWRDEERSFDSQEEAREQYVQDGVDSERIDQMIDDLEEVVLEEYFEESNFFLTQRGYQHHVNLNRHNLTEPHSYVRHAFRNSELLGLLEAVGQVVGVPYARR